MRSIICFILVFFVTLGCLTATSTQATADQFAAITAAEYQDQARDSSPQPVVSTDLVIENRLYTVEEQQAIILQQQAVIANRLDTIIEHIGETENGN